MNEILQQRIEAAVKKTACPQCVFNDGGTCNNDDDCKLFDDFVGLMTFALQNQWVSVNEALPKENRIIARLSESFCGTKDCIEVLHFCERYGLTSPEGYYDLCGENVPTSAITHWMPIPEMKGGEE